MEMKVANVLADLYGISQDHGYLDLYLTVEDMLYNSPPEDLDRRTKLVFGIVEGIKEVYRLEQEEVV